jgi:hypothetical protein
VKERLSRSRFLHACYLKRARRGCHEEQHYEAQVAAMALARGLFGSCCGRGGRGRGGGDGAGAG